MKLVYEKSGFTETGDDFWQWIAQTDDRSTARRAGTPLDALTRLACALAVDLGVSPPELMADRRLSPFGDNMFFPWSASAGDGAEVGGPDPEHVMYGLCEMLETALEEQTRPEGSNV